MKGLWHGTQCILNTIKLDFAKGTEIYWCPRLTIVGDKRIKIFAIHFFVLRLACAWWSHKANSGTKFSRYMLLNEVQ